MFSIGSTEIYGDGVMSSPNYTFPPPPDIPKGEMRVKARKKKGIRGSKLSPMLRDECRDIYTELRSRYPKAQFKNLGDMIHDIISVRHP